MKNFLDRIGKVVHWLGFIYSLVLIFVVMFAMFSDISSGIADRWFVQLIVGLPFAGSFWVGGWILRYLITGKKHILPWKRRDPR